MGNYISSSPPGTTHSGLFYREELYYKRKEHQHLNQVSEEWQTLVSWEEWLGNKWVKTQSDFSDRNLRKL